MVVQIKYGLSVQILRENSPKNMIGVRQLIRNQLNMLSYKCYQNSCFSMNVKYIYTHPPLVITNVCLVCKLMLGINNSILTSQGAKVIPILYQFMPITRPKLYLFHTNQKLILDPILGLLCMFNEFQTNNGHHQWSI